MTKVECALVRKKLETYQWHIRRAEQEEARIRDLEDKYRSMATPACIPVTPREGSSGHSNSRESVYLEIFDEQREAQRKATESRAEAKRIENFIRSIGSDRRELLELAYLQGKRYWEIGKDKGYSIEGVRKAIIRCLEATPATVAVASGLL